MPGFPDEVDSAFPEDATCAQLCDEAAILNALRYIQYLEGRVRRLRKENRALRLRKIVYAWRVAVLIVSRSF